MIDVSPHISMLTELVHKTLAAKGELEFIANVSEESEKLGIQQSSPDLLGLCIRSKESGEHRILISQTIPRHKRDSVITGMYARGSRPEDIELPADDTNFLMHLVLHECAHATSSAFSELECDDWAFEKLRNET